MKKSQYDSLLFMLALFMSTGIVCVSSGSALLDQIDFFKWAHDDKSLSLEIQNKINADIMKGTAMEIGGYLLMVGGTLYTFLSFRKSE